MHLNWKVKCIYSFWNISSIWASLVYWRGLFLTIFFFAIWRKPSRILYWLVNWKTRTTHPILEKVPFCIFCSWGENLEIRRDVLWDVIFLQHLMFLKLTCLLAQPTHFQGDGGTCYMCSWQSVPKMRKLSVNCELCLKSQANPNFFTSSQLRKRVFCFLLFFGLVCFRSISLSFISYISLSFTNSKP